MNPIRVLLAFGLLVTMSFTGVDPKQEKLNKELLLRLVNEARQKGCKCGGRYYKPVPPLSWNDQLERAAVAHSRDMMQRKYFDHISRNGQTPGDRIRRTGYRWMAYGENIGLGQADEKEVVQSWLSSAGHCSNIMSRDFKEMGIGKVGEYWTQTFGASSNQP